MKNMDENTINLLYSHKIFIDAMPQLTLYPSIETSLKHSRHSGSVSSNGPMMAGLSMMIVSNGRMSLAATITFPFTPLFSIVNGRHWSRGLKNNYKILKAEKYLENLHL